MQSARKKSTRILSALSVAAVSALAASNAHGVTLTMYYGQESNYANSSNGIFISTGYGPYPSGPTSDSQGEFEYLRGRVTAQSVSNSGVTTVTVPIGDYLSLAIDAVLTGNANPYGGKSFSGSVQPAYLGLSGLSAGISSSDATGQLLTPIGSPYYGPNTTINSLPSYISTAEVPGLATNNSSSGTELAGLDNAGGGEVQPNLPGYDTAPNSSGSLVGFPSSALGPMYAETPGRPIPGESANLAELQNFAPQSNVASYANAFDFADDVTFEALKPGTVTLAPFVVTSSTEYWSAAAGQTGITKYTATNFSGSDVINNVPLLVVQVDGSASAQPIVALGGAISNTYGWEITNGTSLNRGLFNPSNDVLFVSGGHGSYTVASVTEISGGSGMNIGNVLAGGFTPGDQIIYAIEVLVNGTQATSAELATLVTAINAGDGNVPSSAGVVASASSPAPDPFGSQYNLFLDTTDTGSGFDALGLDFSHDANLIGYAFSSIAVIPEPTTLGLLALGGVALMTRRDRRKT